MKHITLFEGFISNLFKSTKSREYSRYWKYDERKKLEELGFYNLDVNLSTYSNILDNGESYYYTPKFSDTIKNIVIRKYEGKQIGPEIDSEEYEVTINIDDENKIKKDLSKFSDVLEFIKKYIQVEIDIKKYNI